MADYARVLSRDEKTADMSSVLVIAQAGRARMKEGLLFFKKEPLSATLPGPGASIPGWIELTRRRHLG
jgi:hypothetical protein